MSPVFARRPAPAWVRGVGTATAAALLACALTACADEPVNLDVPGDTTPVSAADQQTCQEFLDDLPDSLAGHERRKVNPAAALGRAWGDPAIVVRCAVQLPEGFEAGASCEVADGVGWYVPEAEIDDQDSDVVFTAVEYRPVVEVDVPHDYRPEGGAAAITQLAAPVRQHLERAGKCE